MPYHFEGGEDEQKAIRWILSTIAEGPAATAPGQADEAEDLRYELTQRLSELSESYTPRPDSWYAELWDRFIFAVSGVHPGEADANWDPPFEWREWEFDGPQKLAFGFSSAHEFAEVPQGGGSSKHYYSEIPPHVVWHLTPVVQKSTGYFVGKAPLAEIDAVCSVPQLPAELSSPETARRVLDRSLGTQEWQRRLETRRVLAISNFIDLPSNIIANAAIVQAPNCEAISVDSSGTVKVDFGRFLHKHGGRWTDHRDGSDLRPMWLIDGQHRVRGLAQSAAGIGLELPVILFPPAFDISSSAKIFAEINTLQTKLTPLHSLFMQHRFDIPSPNVKRDFRPWTPGDGASIESRANHLSYECAAYLSSNREGPLFGLVKFLDQNRGREYVSQAHQWVDFTRAWFLRGGPYPPESPEAPETIRLEVESYFRAFVATCNHGEWTDGEPRWSLNTWKKGLLQRQGPSQALLRLYPTAWSLARRRTTRTPIPEQTFAEILSPLRWVDWMDSDLVSTYTSSGERPRNALRVWMETALRHGRVYPRRSVMSKSNRSEPGRGILSPPGPSRIKVVSETRWPSPSGPVLLEATRPVNTLPTSRWTVFDSDRVDRTYGRGGVPAEGESARFRIEYDSYLEYSEYLDVRVDWSNAVSPPGHGTIRLKRR